MRVISGTAKGKKIFCCRSDKIRPTKDRIKESIFNIVNSYLSSMIKDWYSLNVADICAGTGAIGIEFLSRGARHVTFVDMNQDSINLINKNLVHCNLNNNISLINLDARRLHQATSICDVVFIDLPYSETEIIYDIVSVLADNKWINEQSLIIIEVDTKFCFLLSDNIILYKKVIYGRNTIYFIFIKY